MKSFKLSCVEQDSSVRAKSLGTSIYQLLRWRSPPEARRELAVAVRSTSALALAALAFDRVRRAIGSAVELDQFAAASPAEAGEPEPAQGRGVRFPPRRASAPRAERAGGACQGHARELKRQLRHRP